MKGVILAGGTGSRLLPLTKVTNKHLLPVYNEPMIHFPLRTLINANITEIMIVAGRDHAERFMELLGSGSEFGIDLTYKIQDNAEGIAQALGLCKNFVKGNSVAVVLGDNIFDDKFDFSDFREGAKLFLKRVPDANRFGVARIRYDSKENKNKIIEIIEKPKFEKTDNELIDKNGWGWAVTGLYIFSGDVFDKIDQLKPSNRGELEISDINNMYIKEDRIDFDLIKGFWSDAGTFENMFISSEFIRNKIMKDD